METFIIETDYIAPRVQRKGFTSLELEEAVWILKIAR
jgi:hypothetical protein